MVVDPETFRAALGRFATGITVVTVEADGVKHGMTASSFASVSLIPPRVLVCLDKSSRTRALLSDTFAINILSAQQEEISRSFAHTGQKPFETIEHEVGSSGAPLIRGALAWIECATSSIVDGGDHDIIIGDVMDCRAVVEGQPLIYFMRSYRTLDS